MQPPPPRFYDDSSFRSNSFWYSPYSKYLTLIERVASRFPDPLTVTVVPFGILHPNPAQCREPHSPKLCFVQLSAETTFDIPFPLTLIDEPLYPLHCAQITITLHALATTANPTGPKRVLIAALSAVVAVVKSPCTTTNAPPWVVSTPYRIDTLPSTCPKPPCIALFSAAAAVFAAYAHHRPAWGRSLQSLPLSFWL